MSTGASWALFGSLVVAFFTFLVLVAMDEDDE